MKIDAVDFRDRDEVYRTYVSSPRRAGKSWSNEMAIWPKFEIVGVDLASDERKIPYKEGSLDERDIDLLLIKMVGADNDMVKSVLDDPALRKAARVLAGTKVGDKPPHAKDALVTQLQRAANALVDNLRERAGKEADVVKAEERVLIVRQQIDSLLAGVDKIAA